MVYKGKPNKILGPNTNAVKFLIHKIQQRGTSRFTNVICRPRGSVQIAKDIDIEAAQMKFLRHLLGITKLDKEKNQCIRQKTGAQNIVQEIKQYQEKWLKHVQRMDTNRLPKQALKYKANGRRNIGRPRKRWRDQLHLED